MASGRKRAEKVTIENPRKRQTTFYKRGSCLIKKAHEISVLCDVDVAVLAFEPTGSPRRFCSRRRIEDVLRRYIHEPVHNRFQHVKDLKLMLKEMKQLSRIKGDENRLHYLDSQSVIKVLELRVKKATVDLETLEEGLEGFEVNEEKDPSLDQILLCEKNLKSSLQQVTERKRMLVINEMFPRWYGQFRLSQRDGMEMEKQGSTSFQYNFTGNKRTQASFVEGGLPLPAQLHQSDAISYVALDTNSSGFGQPLIHQETYPPIYPSTQHQPIIKDHIVPYQQVELLGTSSLDQPFLRDPISDVSNQQLGELRWPVLDQPMIRDHLLPVIPNFEQLCGSLSMGRLVPDNPFGAQQNPTPNPYHDPNNPANPNEMSNFGGFTHDARQNLNAILPRNSRWYSSRELRSEIFFNKKISPSNSSSNVDSNNNISKYGSENTSNTEKKESIPDENIGGNSKDNENCDANDNHPAGPTEPNPQSPTDFTSPQKPSEEADKLESKGTSPTAGNDDGSMEWDGYALAEKLNMEDIEIVY